MQQYLKLPLRFGKIIEGNRMDICDIKNSIARNLHLLITTVRGEHKRNENYGAEYLDYDYDIHLANDSRREIIIKSVKHQISNYEKRLENVEVQVEVNQEVVKTDSGLIQRRRVAIIINSLIARSAEPFSFKTAFFIGPMDFD